MIFFVVFFFFKQKTAYEMRISDWSSDVCSSDLRLQAGGLEPGRGLIKTRRMTWDQIKQHLVVQFAALGAGTHGVVLQRLDEQLILTFARAGDGDHRAPERLGEHAATTGLFGVHTHVEFEVSRRSEERSVGKECVRKVRSRGEA